MGAHANAYHAMTQAPTSENCRACSYSTVRSLVLADVDGDGHDDIVAGTLQGTIHVISGATGEPLWSEGPPALGIPQVAAFGSTSPEHTPPLNPRARVLWLKDELQLDCMPCFERTCRYGHYRCLTGVPAARVQAALDDALLKA